MKILSVNELLTVPARIEYLPQYLTSLDTNGMLHVYVFDHSALTNGYVKKYSACNPVLYNGNFGKGYTVNIHNANSSRYALKVYYTEVSHNAVCNANDNCTRCPLYAADENGEHCLY